MSDERILMEEPQRILIVDDDSHIQRLIGKYLTKSGYEIESCIDSKDVIKIVKSFSPDLILMDLMMPVLDGISATKRIRNMKLTSYLPIIVILKVILEMHL